MPGQSLANGHGPAVIIACAVMERQVGQVVSDCSGVTVRFLEQGLHRSPEKICEAVQQHIDKASEYAGKIILGYGLCSNGIAGVIARRQGLIVPRSHDCLGFFLGSPHDYVTALKKRPGIYYLTPYWITNQCDPLGIVELDYTPRVGREMAVWAMQEELKHYTHMILIRTSETDAVPIRERAMANSKFFQKKYGEVQGSLDYFKRLLHGPYTKEEFIVLKPGEKVRMEMFL